MLLRSSVGKHFRRKCCSTGSIFPSNFRCSDDINLCVYRFYINFPPAVYRITTILCKVQDTSLILYIFGKYRYPLGVEVKFRLFRPSGIVIIGSRRQKVPAWKILVASVEIEIETHRLPNKGAPTCTSREISVLRAKCCKIRPPSK